MRIAGLGIVMLALVAACGETIQPETAVTAEPAKTVMEAEAEKACAEMTGFGRDAPRGQSSETRTKLRREYDLCVQSVAGGDDDAAAVAAANTPALRGRSPAP